MYILYSSCPSAHLSVRGCLANNRGLQNCWRIRDSLGLMFTGIPYCTTTGRGFVVYFSGHISVLTKNSAAGEWWGSSGLREDTWFFLLFNFDNLELGTDKKSQHKKKWAVGIKLQLLFYIRLSYITSVIPSLKLSPSIFHVFSVSKVLLERLELSPCLSNLPGAPPPDSSHFLKLFCAPC